MSNYSVILQAFFPLTFRGYCDTVSPDWIFNFVRYSAMYKETIMTGQQVALMIGGIVVVFLVLAVLILFISIMGWIFKSLAKRSAPKATPTPTDDVPDAAFIAAVSAAINKINPVDDNRSIRIKSIRKV